LRGQTSRHPSHHCKVEARKYLASPDGSGYPPWAIMRGSRGMKERWRRLGLGLLGLSLLALPACRPRERAASARGRIHGGIVFDSGGKDDRSFNAAAWRGVRRAAKDFPIVLRDAEPGDPTSLEPAMRAFAERGYDLVIGIGFAQTPIVEQVAKDYPKIDF